MATITAACGRTILVDDEDHQELSRHRWQIGSHGYAQRWIPELRTTVPMHRLLLGLRSGDGLQADHVNHDRLDNRRENLRVVTVTQHAQNRPRTGTSNTRQWRSGRWQARVKVQGKEVPLGTFDTQQEAHAVAQAWIAEHLPFAAAS